MKSETKIVLINYNIHVHTCLKLKKQLFLNFIIIHENKGGERSPSAEKMTFFGLTEIAGRWGGRRVQNLAG
jgi:hypothetical protein